ncbi:MAG: hypothetical protein M0R74_09085 [Dehalococcoidia bacterium]|jgi:hypothetical protein|nr:hypothetical protein [Dehalococcoidia bacterium]
MAAHDAENIPIPIRELIAYVVDIAVARAFQEHIRSCPQGSRISVLENKTTRLELSFVRLVLLLLGSGVLSGSSVWWLANFAGG